MASPSPLLRMPDNVRSQIFEYVAAGEYKFNCTGLLHTCKQTRVKLEPLCVPHDLTDIDWLIIYLEPEYNPTTWIRLSIYRNLHHSDFGIKSLDDPLITRLIKQVKSIHYTYISVGRPRYENHLDAFMLLFSKIQDTAALLRRLPGGNIFRTMIWREAAKKEHNIPGYERPFWQNRPTVPLELQALIPEGAQTLCHYEYITMPLARIPEYKNTNYAVRFSVFGPELRQEAPWLSEFEVFDNTGKGHRPGFQTLIDCINHRIECRYCRRDQPRSESCRRQWREPAGKAKAYARIRKRVETFTHALPGLLDVIIELGEHVGGPFENICRQRLATRDLSGMNYLSKHNTEHNRWKTT